VGGGYFFVAAQYLECSFKSDFEPIERTFKDMPNVPKKIVQNEGKWFTM